MTKSVYLISNGQHFKIGVAKDVRRRLATLQTSSSAKLSVLGIASGGVDAETRLHAELSPYRLKGEWFALPDHILERLCRQVFVVPFLRPQRLGSVKGQRGNGQMAGSGIGEAICKFLSSVHPVNTADCVSKRTGIKISAVRKWFERKSAPKADSLGILIASYGPELLATAMDQVRSRPAWVTDAIASEKAETVIL